MRYEYFCSNCDMVYEIEKKMADPNPAKCPICESDKFERYFSAESLPSVIYPGRPIWTYSDVKRYKTFRQNGGPLQKVDLTKHGDLGAWHTDAAQAPEPKKKKKGKKK